MNDKDSILSRIYSTLLEIRYPPITKAEPHNVESTILTGDNRICLLSWLLTEKSKCAANVLNTLEGSALKDQLFKYYSEIGICTKQDLLFGNCTMKEQLPTLRLLTEFMENVHMESFNREIPLDKSSEDILITNGENDGGIISSCSSLKPKLSLTEAVEYFQQIRNDLEIDETELSAPDTATEVKEMQTSPKDEKNVSSIDECCKEIENFIKAYSTIGLSATCQSKSKESTSYSMDEDVRKLSKNLSNLNETFTTLTELSQINIPEKIHQVNTPFNGVIQDVLTCMAKTQFIHEED